jgi:hypothetical protein
MMHLSYSNPIDFGIRSSFQIALLARQMKGLEEVSVEWVFEQQQAY